MSTHIASTVRRIALLALGLLVVLTGLGVAASPASALPPNQPRNIEALGYENVIRVYVSPPKAFLGGADVTGYQVERTAPNQPTKTWNVANTAAIEDTSAVLNVQYSYRARASSAEGWSAWSETTGAKRSVSYHELDSFSSTTAFVNRQYADLLGRPPTNAERANAVQNLDLKAWTPSSFLAMLIGNPVRTPRHQVIRLYNAYFDRNADHAGLDFWFDQISNKGKSINTVSSSFVASPEFKEMYGNLTNGQFVTLVYQNVLDRAPSPTDHAYWKGQLDQKVINRGRLMTLFSESGEYKALSRGVVLAADVYDAMIGEASAGAELDHWGSHIQGGGQPGPYAVRVMNLNIY